MSSSGERPTGSDGPVRNRDRALILWGQLIVLRRALAEAHNHLKPCVVPMTEVGAWLQAIDEVWDYLTPWTSVDGATTPTPCGAGVSTRAERVTGEPDA